MVLVLSDVVEEEDFSTGDVSRVCVAFVDEALRWMECCCSESFSSARASSELLGRGADKWASL
jgi:hypothetical protein